MYAGETERKVLDLVGRSFYFVLYLAVGPVNPTCMLTSANPVMPVKPV